MPDIDGSCQRHNGAQIESAAVKREFCIDRPSISPGREMDSRLLPRPETFARLIKGAVLFSPRSRRYLRRRSTPPPPRLRRCRCRLENKKHDSSCRFASTFDRESVGANARRARQFYANLSPASLPLFLYTDDNDNNNPFGYWVIGYTSGLERASLPLVRER